MTGLVIEEINEIKKIVNFTVCYYIGVINDEKKDEVLEEIQKAVELEQAKTNEIERMESINASKSGISKVPKVVQFKEKCTAENDSNNKTYFDLDSQRLSFKE